MFHRMGVLLIAAVFAVTAAPSAKANDFEPQIKAFVAKQIMPWLNDKIVIDSIKAQNVEHASLDAAKIDAMDKDWRAQAKAGGGPLTEKLLGNDLSKFLKGKQAASNGLISEMFVMDDKGLNVGQSGMTSDYMQGDEAKWQKSYGVGPGAMFIDEVEFDDSSKSFQSQVSVTISDPADGKAIGAITVGVNVEKL